MSDFSTAIKTVKARKEHECTAYKIIMESQYGENDFEVIEWCKIKEMKGKSGKIKNGEEYFFWSGACDAGMFESRCNKEMYEIVSKYEWWGWQ